MDTIHEAIAHNITVRCDIQCDHSDSPCSSSSDPLEIVNTIATLADAGCSCIMLTPSDHTSNQNSSNQIDEDLLRDMIENAFNLDVVGDPISERLGLAGDRFLVNACTLRNDKYLG